MHANNEKGALLPRPAKIEILLNFCRVVLRSDDDLLQLAIGEYQEFLSAQQRG